MQPSLPTEPDRTKSLQMARVRSKNTEPEIVVRRALHARGYRFRLHRKDLPGKPDIVLPKHGLAILVHGCFWHGCPRCDRGRRLPKTNVAFWSAKLTANRERDIRSTAALEAAGWRVAVLWECDIRTPGSLDGLLDACLSPPRLCA
nr:very short patch repair endonuclease [uncultured Rhodopila sp.]